MNPSIKGIVDKIHEISDNLDTLSIDTNIKIKRKTIVVCNLTKEEEKFNISVDAYVTYPKIVREINIPIILKRGEDVNERNK